MSPGKSDQTKGLRLQRRDFDLFATLGEVGLLDTLTLHRRFFPADKTLRSCRRRLQLYADYDLTQQVFVRLSSTKRHGRLPTIHRLTKQGADVLQEETGQRPLRFARSDPPKLTRTLLHRLGMAKTQLAVNDACLLKQLPKPEWILEYDSILDAPLNAPLSDRFILRHDFPAAAGKFTCWPDAACLLSIPHKGQPLNLAILWEYDRSTEGHVQLADKLPGYEAFLSTKAYQRLWPNARGVRIFFVVQSEQRLRNVIETIRDSAAAPFVRLAVVSKLSPERLLTERIWWTVEGGLRAILGVDS